MTEWEHVRRRIHALRGRVQIALVGKYVQLPDAYLSVNEALDHAGIFHDVKVNIDWLDAESPNLEALLAQVDGILVPGGFGVPRHRGQDRRAAATPARTRCRTSASASACRSRSSSSPATSPD